jgi:hypothetical protein
MATMEVIEDVTVRVAGEGVRAAVNDAVARTAAIAGLGGIALIHCLQSPEAFEETTYLGILFVGAIVAALGVAALLTRTSDDRVWLAAGGLATLILIGYVLSRTSGLPDATVDVGNWSEPLGLASLVAEGLVVFVAGALLATRFTAPRG